MYEYQITLLRVIDGDTIEADIDLGFDVWLKKTPIRIYGINAPELKAPTLDAGLVTKARLIELLTGKTLVVRTTYKKEKDTFKRVLGTVFADDLNVGDRLLAEGLAVVYKEKK